MGFRAQRHGNTLNVARFEDVIQLMSAKGCVSIGAFVRGTTFAPGETYLTARSDRVNTDTVSRSRGKKKAPRKRTG
jgi:hypothetical protein